MKAARKINEPRVIIFIFVIVGLLLFLFLKPVLFSAPKPAPKGIDPEKVSTIKQLPGSYSEIKTKDPEPPAKVPDPVMPEKPKPVVIDEIKPKSKPVVIRPVKKEPTQREIDIEKGRTAPIGFASFKPANRTNFGKDQSIKASLRKPGSQYIIQAGSVISAITVTGINSDLPGSVVAQIDRNVYDTISGDSLLIPQGAKLLGTYTSNIKLNQKRVQISWRKIKLPDGSTIDLGKGQAGVGRQGMAGAEGEVDNHYFANAFSIFSVSLMNSTAKQISSASSGSLKDEVSGDTAEDIVDAGSDIFREQIQLGPTIEIPIGSVISVLLSQDLIFEGPYDAS